MNTIFNLTFSLGVLITLLAQGCQAEICAGTGVHMECPTFNQCPSGWKKSFYDTGFGDFKGCTCTRRLTDEEYKNRTECLCNYYISGCTRQPCFTSGCDYDCRQAMDECPQDVKNDLCSGNRTDYKRWEKFCPEPTPIDPQLSVQELLDRICTSSAEDFCYDFGTLLIVEIGGTKLLGRSCEEDYDILCRQTSTTTRMPILN
ncbi:uncharacterized protein LOC110849789 isoform X1 [Folsomia candida]|uniref:uncharacterized protein LOC110849789 isoform X1 n=1 Tax=Folsomia candida TaxID=158441 RepID=UPI000B8FB3BF|nr:uncharacterized protein LOC110849789 isoform X1 [Folsomia candida]